MSESPLYEHRQSPLWPKIVILVIFAVPLLIAYVQHAPVGLMLTFVIVPALILGLFSSLKVPVTASEIKLLFGMGLIHRTISRDSIESVAAVRNSWWYGFGIRLTPHGWLWNISGLDAVEITYKDGKKFRIGTDEPEKLLQALQ